MRKLTIALLLVSLFVFSIAPSFAQDEPSQTIAEIVVASAGGDPAEFTILLAAVSAADPAILEALSNPEASLTVFAPTDAAFAAAFEALGVTPEDVLGNPAMLNSILLYHVLPAAFDSSVLLTAGEGICFGTALHYSASMVTSDGETVMVDGATVVTADIAASNGVIHVIDAVLVPADLEGHMAMMEEMAGMEMEAMGTIAELGAATPELTTLMQAVGLADPAVGALLSNPGAMVTVFAPVNEAFATLPSDVQAQALSDTAVLTGILAYHVVPGTLNAEALMATSEMMEGGPFKVMTLAGVPLTFLITEEGVMINDTVMVTATDVMADNGIVHLINGILLPPTAE